VKCRLLFVLLIVALAGCDNPQNTVDQVRREIATYKAAPSDAEQVKIEADLAKLDVQIKKLAESGKTVEAESYRNTAENLKADYRAARMMRAMDDAKAAVKDIGDAVKQAGKSIGDVFREPTPSPTP
jgi:uncharacterized protein YukE